MTKNIISNSETNKENNLSLFKSEFYQISNLDVTEKINEELSRVSIELKNFAELKKYFDINSNLLKKKVISISFHLSEPENVIKLSTLSFPSSLTNLVMMFNGLPQIDSFKFINSLNLDLFTINLNLQGFFQFWKELQEPTKIKILNIYVHLGSFSEFNSLFTVENEEIKKIYEKVYTLSRSRSLEGLNLNITFDSSSKEEEEVIINDEFKLKYLIFSENKYYFGFLKIYSMNIILNPGRDFFIFSSPDKSSKKKDRIMVNDKSLEKSLKLCATNDISILFAMKKKRFGNYVVQNVFKFLAKKEYTIVNFSKAYYKR